MTLVVLNISICFCGSVVCFSGCQYNKYYFLNKNIFSNIQIDFQIALSVSEQFIFLGTHPFTLSVILRLQGLLSVGVKFNPIKVYLLPFGIAGETWSLFPNHFSFWVPTYMVWLSQFFNLVIYLKLSPCTFLSKFWKDIIRHKHSKTIPWNLQSKRTSL